MYSVVCHVCKVRVQQQVIPSSDLVILLYILRFLRGLFAKLRKNPRAGLGFVLHLDSVIFFSKEGGRGTPGASAGAFI